MEHMIYFQPCHLPVLECRGCECGTGRAPEKQVARLSHLHRAGYRSVLVLQFSISVFLFTCTAGSIIMVSLHNCSVISLGTSVAILRLCLNKAPRDTRYSQKRNDCKILSYFLYIFLLRCNKVPARMCLLLNTSEATFFQWFMECTTPKQWFAFFSIYLQEGAQIQRINCGIRCFQ